MNPVSSSRQDVGGSSLDHSSISHQSRPRTVYASNANSQQFQTSERVPITQSQSRTVGQNSSISDRAEFRPNDTSEVLHFYSDNHSLLPTNFPAHPSRVPPRDPPSEPNPLGEKVKVIVASAAQAIRGSEKPAGGDGDAFSQVGRGESDWRSGVTRSKGSVDFYEDVVSSAKYLAAPPASELAIENKHLSKRIVELELDLNKKRIEAETKRSLAHSLRAEAQQLPSLSAQLERLSAAVREASAQGRAADSKYFAFQSELTGFSAQIQQLKFKLEEEKQRNGRLAAEAAKRHPSTDEEATLELRMRSQRIKELEAEKSSLFAENFDLKQKTKIGGDTSFSIKNPSDPESLKLRQKTTALEEENKMLREELDLLRKNGLCANKHANTLYEQREQIFNMKKDNEYLAKELQQALAERELSKSESKAIYYSPLNLKSSQAPPREIETFPKFDPIVKMEETAKPLVPALAPQQNLSPEEKLLAEILAGNEKLRRELAAEHVSLPPKKNQAACLPPASPGGISQKIRGLFS